MKIRNQFALLIACAGLFAFLLFEFLWLNKWPISSKLTGEDFYHTQLDDLDFLDKFYEKAKELDLPENEDDTETIALLKPLFNLADEYTSIYLYDSESGMYLAGEYASIMKKENLFPHVFHIGYRLTDGEGENMRFFPLDFHNGTALVMMANYHRSLFLYPYLCGCLFLSLLLFFLIVLFFISRKMKSIVTLEKEVLTMASGDLTHPLPELGEDEIGILSQELNHLRETLNENIIKEQESRKANQDLITALSHDLRTPLTILTGYLEVLKHKRNPDMQEEYLEKCLRKTEDIKELTDRMFEYALVSEENETPEFTWISADFIRQSLQENCDFIRLAGFHPTFSMPESSCVLQSDKTMLKRIFTNLFSNILKYGDKKEPVLISGTFHKKTLIVTISNTIKTENAQVNSNNIGLKSVQKMLYLLDGEMTVKKNTDSFTVELKFYIL